MSIKFACGCGKAYKVPEKFAGKRVKCKECGEAVRVPSESEAEVGSTRAAAVSKRSILASQRVPASTGSASGRVSSKSGRTSGRAPAGGSSRSAAPATSARTKRPGSGTERFEPVDLNEGNELKKFARKRDEEFKRGEGRFTYFEGGKPVKAYRLTKGDMTIGRDDACTITVPCASVSKEHAKVEYKLGTFIITDQQSSNGLLVNGKSVRRCSLKDGDVLQLGEAILRIDCG